MRFLDFTENDSGFDLVYLAVGTLGTPVPVEKTKPHYRTSLLMQIPGGAGSAAIRRRTAAIDFPAGAEDSIGHDQAPAATRWLGWQAQCFPPFTVYSTSPYSLTPVTV